MRNYDYRDKQSNQTLGAFYAPGVNLDESEDRERSERGTSRELKAPLWVAGTTKVAIQPNEK